MFRTICLETIVDDSACAIFEIDEFTKALNFYLKGSVNPFILDGKVLLVA